MRPSASTPILASMLLLGVGPTRADVVVLKDGRTITTAGPPVVKGRVALLKTPDGKLFSLPVEEIDAAKTEAERLKPAPAPTPAATPPLRPPRPAEIAGKTNPKKATVVLTDEQVAGGIPSDEGEKKPDEGEPVIEISSSSAVKTAVGYAFTGSVLNTGKGEASGVAVTIEAVGAENKPLASAFAELAKDKLAPGEKSTFKAQMANTPEDPRVFRYLPRWQTRVAVKSAAASPGAPGAPPPRLAPGGETDRERGDEEVSRPPEPKPTPRMVRVPQPDMAAPAANAPIGAPDKPGGTFLPKPTGDQPKPPGGN